MHPPPKPSLSSATNASTLLLWQKYKSEFFEAIKLTDMPQTHTHTRKSKTQARFVLTCSSKIQSWDKEIVYCTK